MRYDMDVRLSGSPAPKQQFWASQKYAPMNEIIRFSLSSNLKVCRLELFRSSHLQHVLVVASMCSLCKNKCVLKKFKV